MGMLSLCIFSMLLCHNLVAVNSLIINQDSGIIPAAVGQTVTLKCSCQTDTITFFTWYRQSLGSKPLIISTRMRHNTGASINNEFKERFRVKSGEGINDLTISSLLPSDSAMYYCGILEFNAIEFGDGAFLHVRESLPSIPFVVYQPALEQLRLGDSLNLSCSVHTEKCTGERNLFWFKHGADKPAIMYQNVGQCMNEIKSGTKNCTSYFLIKSVNSSDAGMYYCALVSCGEIVFGKGTRVEIGDGGDSGKVTRLVVYCLIVALVVSVILLLALVCVLYKLKSQSCSVCKGAVSHMPLSAASEVMGQDENVLHYAALSLKKTKERHHQQETDESVSVYSRIKSRKV